MLDSARVPGVFKRTCDIPGKSELFIQLTQAHHASQACQALIAARDG
jgi:hypothetical protein